MGDSIDHFKKGFIKQGCWQYHNMLQGNLGGSSCIVTNAPKPPHLFLALAPSSWKSLAMRAEWGKK
jgi:hypothetical protein